MTFDTIGFARVLAVGQRIGAGGFLAYWLWSLMTFVLLGAAWLAVARGESARRLPLFSWARLVREATSDLLPFSQLGGLIFSGRVLQSARIPGTRVYASMIADQTTEIASQLLFTLFGLAMLAPLLTGKSATPGLIPAIAIALAVLVGLIVLVTTSRRWIGPIARSAAGRLLPASAATAVADVAAEVTAIYARRDLVAWSFTLNLAAWLFAGIGAWLVLQIMGIDFPIGRTLALEAVIFALRSAAFAIPAGIGVQEVGYALVAPLIGLPAEAALALALAKRARDLSIAVPVLLIWQVDEARALITAQRRRAAD